MVYFNIMILKLIVLNFMNNKKKLLLLEWLLNFGKTQCIINKKIQINLNKKNVVQKYVQIRRIQQIISKINLKL